MFRPPPVRAATRTLAQHNDAIDLRAAIVGALAAQTTAPGDERALRNAVWTYARGERAIGVAPAAVILALTDMVERAKIAPDAARLDRTRGVILWCVEAYFGQLGGGALRDAQQATVGDARVVGGALAPTSVSEPIEAWYLDWRQRLARNLSRRSDARWEPLTHARGTGDGPDGADGT